MDIVKSTLLGNRVKGVEMSPVDTSITHITEANANIFEDPDFDKIETWKSKIKPELMC
uniref:Uncharacterized protein n=1 Tax=Candidatus Kentrum sp. FW TaxID=2126338 RepID=A0A450TU05_9GAMM|nr:MAG: hypothetical protein BECKFW1821C_GA0114237_103241 [Candidatus Kentron sp. FW]